MTRFAIGLGSNLGDRIEHLRSATGRLAELGQLVAVSGLYETEPFGGPPQDPYLNAVLVLETGLDADALLGRLNEIEDQAGRKRSVRWGPRTLDLDIVSSDGDPVSTERLTIPHPRASEREFVLRPLADVWPEARVAPGTEAKNALEAVGDQGVDLLARSWIEERHWPGQVFVAIQLVWFVSIALAMASDGSLPNGTAEVTRLIGVALAVVGAALAFISSRRLGPGLTPVPEPRTDAQLVVSGPYALVRHPIYGGVILFIFGASLIVDSVTATLLSLGLVPFFYLKTEYEERQLRIRFPDYRGYRERVTRRLVPFVI